MLSCLEHKLNQMIEQASRRRQYIVEEEQQEQEQEQVDEKQCAKCHEIKNGNDFKPYTITKKDKRNKRCRSCIGTYYPEKILDKRRCIQIHKTRRIPIVQYLIQWKGSDDQTWECRSDLHGINKKLERDFLKSLKQPTHIQNNDIVVQAEVEDDIVVEAEVEDDIVRQPDEEDDVQQPELQDEIEEDVPEESMQEKEAQQHEEDEDEEDIDMETEYAPTNVNLSMVSPNFVETILSEPTSDEESSYSEPIHVVHEQNAQHENEEGEEDIDMETDLETILSEPTSDQNAQHENYYLHQQPQHQQQHQQQPHQQVPNHVEVLPAPQPQLIQVVEYETEEDQLMFDRMDLIRLNIIKLSMHLHCPVPMFHVEYDEQLILVQNQDFVYICQALFEDNLLETFFEQFHIMGPMTIRFYRNDIMQFNLL